MGIGVERNQTLAFILYKKAAKNGGLYGEAYFSLGVCYDFGLGVGKDPEKAAYWYEKATTKSPF